MSSNSAGVETAPLPSVNDIQKTFGVTREEAYQHKLDMQSPDFVKRFSESGMSLTLRGSLSKHNSQCGTPTASRTFSSGSFGQLPSQNNGMASADGAVDVKVEGQQGGGGGKILSSPSPVGGKTFSPMASSASLTTTPAKYTSSPRYTSSPAKPSDSQKRSGRPSLPMILTDAEI